MAIDPRISLAAQAPKFGIGSAINIFENAMMNSQTRDIRQAQEGRAAAQAPFQLQAAQQGVTANQQAIDTNQAAIDEQVENRMLRSLSEFGLELGSSVRQGIASGDQQKTFDLLGKRMVDLTNKGLPTETTEAAILAIGQGDTDSVLSGIDVIQQKAQQRGLFSNNLSLKQRDFNTNVATVKGDPKLKTIEGKAAAVNLGLLARKSSAASIEIANDPELSDAVATSEAKIAGAKSKATEGEKLTQQRKHKPAIARAIKLAEAAAAEQGAVLTDLQRAEAGLPGLIEATDKLKGLAQISTSTFGGRVFDIALKESGWGSTEGANARTKFIAIIDNQVLPLLKQTFGGAMTEGEGLRLSNTLGNPDVSPEQKMLQIEAFMEHQVRQIGTLTRQAEAGAQPQEAPIEVGINEFAGFKVVR